MSDLHEAEKLKFELLAGGAIAGRGVLERLLERTGGRDLTPADYASTSGLILMLDNDVWVNTPVAQHNANFVGDATTCRLELDGDDLFVISSSGARSEAKLCPPPAFHGEVDERGDAYTGYAFSHTDRVRISPIEGCSMTCKFCDLPYEYRYRTKRIDGMVGAVRRALDDEVQPAGHVLISGGTPRDADIGYVRSCYEAVMTAFPTTPVDVMMVPTGDVIEVEWLAELGVNELSVNIELFNRTVAKKLMRRKYDQGLNHYLDYLEHAAAVLGGGRVRSMLMVGLEPMEDTLDGVRAIASRGCVPVLSPFRPDPSTPLRDVTPPSADFMQRAYLESREITQLYGMPLGPSCVPCSHNTLTFAASGHGDATVYHRQPHLV